MQTPPFCLSYLPLNLLNIISTILLNIMLSMVHTNMFIITHTNIFTMVMMKTITRRHSVPMICHSSLAVPSSSTLTPSSYSLNIITGEYIASYQSTSKSINFVFLLVVLRANTKILRCKQMASMLHQTDQRQKFKKAKKHQDFIKMLSCRTFEIGSTINITTSFCRVIYWDRVGTL